jgi:hypothetical protein
VPGGLGLAMAHPHWIWLGLFMVGVLAVALYGLTASGHFPAEARSDKFKARAGALVLWATLVVTALAATSMLIQSWWILQWYFSLLGGGAMLLFAPLLLQAFPDSFVDGRRGLLVFSVCAVVLAALMRVAA